MSAPLWWRYFTVSKWPSLMALKRGENPSYMSNKKKWEDGRPGTQGRHIVWAVSTCRHNIIYRSDNSHYPESWWSHRLRAALWRHQDRLSVHNQLYPASARKINQTSQEYFQLASLQVWFILPLIFFRWIWTCLLISLDSYYVNRRLDKLCGCRQSSPYSVNRVPYNIHDLRWHVFWF